MIQELVDRLFAGSGIDVTVIEIPIGPPSGGDPDQKRALELVDKLKKSKDTVHRLCAHFRRMGYRHKAEQLQRWFEYRIVDAEAAMSRISDLPDDLDHEAFNQAIKEFAITLEAIVPEVTSKINAMIDRHRIAICEVDVTDLLA